MENFNFYSPTEFVFGKGRENEVGELVRKYGGSKVLVHYGGQSAVKSGLLEKMCRLLGEGGIEYVTLGGVVPNDFTDPEGTALQGIEAMERFYHAIGMPINIRELIGRDITDDEIREMTRKCSRDGAATCGCLKVLNAADMEAIYRMARG